MIGKQPDNLTKLLAAIAFGLGSVKMFCIQDLRIHSLYSVLVRYAGANTPY